MRNHLESPKIALPANSIHSSSVQFSSVQLSSAQCSTIQFDSVQFNSISFLIQLKSSQMRTQSNSIQCDALHCDSLHFNSIRSKSSQVKSSQVRLNSIQFRSNTIQFMTMNWWIESNPLNSCFSPVQSKSFQFKLFKIVQPPMIPYPHRTCPSTFGKICAGNACWMQADTWKHLRPHWTPSSQLSAYVGTGAYTYEDNWVYPFARCLGLYWVWVFTVEQNMGWFSQEIRLSTPNWWVRFRELQQTQPIAYRMCADQWVCHFVW